MKRFICIVAAVASVSPAMAEVMDKELSRGQIWLSAAIVSSILLVAGIGKRWLLWPLTPLALMFGPTFAWTEWHTPDVGPAIAREAGGSYGIHANLGVSIVLLSTVIAWIGATFRLDRSAENDLKRFRPRQAQLFCLFVAYATGWLFLFSYRGFPATPAIRASLPLILGYTLTGIALGFAIITSASVGGRRLTKFCS